MNVEFVYLILNGISALMNPSYSKNTINVIKKGDKTIIKLGKIQLSPKFGRALLKHSDITVNPIKDQKTPNEEILLFDSDINSNFEDIFNDNFENQEKGGFNRYEQPILLKSDTEYRKESTDQLEIIVNTSNCRSNSALITEYSDKEIVIDHHQLLKLRKISSQR